GAGSVPVVGCATKSGSSAGSPSSAAAATASSGSATTATTAAAATAATAATATEIAQIPEETAGPYPGDGSNGLNVLTEDGIVRSDIRSSVGSARRVAQGVPATIQ